MPYKKRYQYRNVFWVVLAVFIFFTLLGFLAMSVSPVNTGSNWDKLLSWRHILNQVVSFLFATVFYYFSLNNFYRLLAEKRLWTDFIRTIAVALLALAVYNAFSYLFLTEEDLEIATGNGMLKKQITIAMILFSYFISAVLFIGFSLLIAYLTFLRDEKKHNKILEEQKMQLEMEKSQANYNFLKAQINPHFLHNTLNFLYAKSLPYSEELSEGILTLSDIMRYALSEGNTRDGKAPLKDEIEHVRNVIKINQLRFSNNLKVDFEVEGVVNGATIIPFVLITLVENAFKHGDLKNISDPINVKLKVDGKQLHFYCRNKKKTGPKEISTGIGLDNIRKRLDLAYGPAYSFQVRDEAEFYTTELTIKSL